MKDSTKISISIIVSALVIAGVVLLSKQAPSSAQPQEKQAANNGPSEEALRKIRPVTKSDNIRGNINAPIKIVEYSDYECPFCKRFHFTMQKIVEDYKGKVAWVYRHFPLEQLHPKNATKAALASECARKLGGNDAFWKFTDKYFELTPSNDRTDFEATAKEGAKAAGVSYSALKKCVDNKETEAKVKMDLSNAIETGGRGTPWSIVVINNGQKYQVIPGALPYEQVKALIDANLKK